MKEKKINFIKEKELKSKTDAAFKDFVENEFQDNPIKAKFLAFKKTKKEINQKDIL